LWAPGPAWLICHAFYARQVSRTYLAPIPSGASRGRRVSQLSRTWYLRKLVEQARKANEGRDRQRRAQEAAYGFMSAVTGNLAGFEEAIRALFAADRARFDELVEPWPPDVRDHARKLAAGAFAVIVE